MTAIFTIFPYIFWHFIEFPKEISRAILNFLKFGARYFSIPFLFKTLFSHWHRFSWQYPRGFDPLVYLEVFVSNLISRTIGFILRIFLILAGILFEIFIFFFGILVLIIWYFLPIILIFSFFYGIGLLFKI
jgi:hypothetical protein